MSAAGFLPVRQLVLVDLLSMMLATRPGERAVVAVDGRASRIVTAPVLAPLEIGRIVLIVPLNAQEMRGLEQLSSIPLNAGILVRQHKGWTGGGRRIGTGFAPTRSPKLRRMSGQVLK